MLCKCSMDGMTPSHQAGGLSAEEASQASSELNNLLQIIASATSMLEGDAGDETETYRAMLRDSVERAEKLAAGLAVQGGGTSKRTMTRAEAVSAQTERAKVDGKQARQLVLV